MKGWTMPVQRASYRGVRFDVFNVEDSVERSVVEHAYPFVNGADIEDLGLNPLEVRLSAVFYGEGYYSDFKKFLEVLKKQGADVLTHPIRGRLQNMICTSANFYHDAEYTDYVTLNLIFREATPAKPIFLFNNALFGLIDDFLSAIEDFVDDCLAFFAEVMEGISLAANFKARLLGSFGAIYGCYEHLRDLFTLDKAKFNTPASTTADKFKTQSLNACKDIFIMIDVGLTQIAQRQDLTQRAKFDEVLRTINQIDEIPTILVTGKNASAKRKANLKSLTSALSERDTREINVAMQLACTAALMKIATDFIEDETLLPGDIEYIATKVRLQILKNLNTVRAFAQEISPSFAVTMPNTGVYTKSHLVSEKLRNQGQKITKLALSAINRRPPLIIRTVEINGTIQQVAHEFYGDFRRANELLRLNPQVRYPNFIQRGEVLNSYAK